jgi:CheY-like chemotaxis protein/HPt (histidine-containing phosphotransfer) domain-containing protein
VSTLDRGFLKTLEQQLGSSCIPATISGTGLRDLLLERDLAGTESSTDPINPAAPDPHRLEGFRVMVVEDNRVNRRLTMEFLENAGARIHAAVDGNSALKLAEQHGSDVVLMDIQLPGMDGLETLSRLRMIPGYESVPVIALTASASAGERRRCEQAGVADILVKPIREEILLERIRRFTSGNTLESVETDEPPSQPDRPIPKAMGRDEAGRIKPEIADMVREDLPKQLSSALALARDHAYSDLDGEVHRMRGTAAFCGFRELAGICEKIRLALEDENLSGSALDALLEQLEEAVRAVLDEL